MLGIEHHMPIAAEPTRMPRVELVRQVRLADARHPLQRDNRHASHTAAIERGADARQLIVAADEDLVLLRRTGPLDSPAVGRAPAR